MVQIPASVRALLWEYEIPEDGRDGPLQKAVIERVMQRGGWAEMGWLLGAVDRQRMRAFLETRGRRVLAPRELRFWAWVCGVANTTADCWVAEAREGERRWRG